MSNAYRIAQTTTLNWSSYHKLTVPHNHSDLLYQYMQASFVLIFAFNIINFTCKCTCTSKVSTLTFGVGSIIHSKDFCETTSANDLHGTDRSTRNFKSSGVCLQNL